MLTLHGNIFLPRNAPFVREIGISFILETPAPKALYPRSVEILTGIAPPLRMAIKTKLLYDVCAYPQCRRGVLPEQRIFHQRYVYQVYMIKFI